MTNSTEIDPVLLTFIESVRSFCSARALFAIDKILRDGYVTAEELQKQGYVHGARVIGDVRDNGIPIITKKIKTASGRSVANYVFGDVADIKQHKVGGRVAFPASFKRKLIEAYGSTCALSNAALSADELQIDHRIPYLISGDNANVRSVDEFMLLSASMQRSKSWACENCENSRRLYIIQNCKSCYWANPDQFTHVALRPERRVDLVFLNGEIFAFDQMKANATELRISIQSYIKKMLGI